MFREELFDTINMANHTVSISVSFLPKSHDAVLQTDENRRFYDISRSPFRTVLSKDQGAVCAIWISIIWMVRVLSWQVSTIVQSITKRGYQSSADLKRVTDKRFLILKSRICTAYKNRGDTRGGHLTVGAHTCNKVRLLVSINPHSSVNCKLLVLGLYHFIH